MLFTAVAKLDKELSLEILLAFLFPLALQPNSGLGRLHETFGFHFSY
jgi:hypothetical protein